MEEALFINTYLPSEEDYKSFRYIKKAGWIITYALGAVTLFFLICGVLTTLKNGEPVSALLVEMLFCTVLMFLLCPIVSLILRKRAIRTELFMGNGSFRPRSFIFDNDCITWLTGQNQYGNISRVYATAHGVVLIFGKVVAIYVRDDSFTKGDMTSFLQHLVNKGIKIPEKCIKRYAHSTF